MHILFARSMFDGIKDSIQKDRYILIQEGMITDIRDRLPEPHQGLSTVELHEGLTLMPGLINAHDHLQLRSVENKQDDYFAADDVERFERMKRNAERAIHHGVTTLRDCGASRHMALELARLVSEGRALGPDILACGNAISSKNGHLAWMGREVCGQEEMALAVREEHGAGARFIKVTASGGMASAGTDIKSVQFSHEELEAAAETAHELGLKITAHAHSTASIRAVVKAGFDMVEHCTWVGSEGTDYDRGIVKEIIKNGVVVVFTNATGYPRGRVKERWQRMIGTREQRLAIVRDMLEAGVKTIAGTDDSSFDTLAYEIELLNQAGLSSFRALQAATKISADELGIGDRTGSIGRGKKANLIAVAGNPLSDIRVLNDVRFIMKDGILIRHPS